MTRFSNRTMASRLPKPAYRQLADHIKIDPLKEATVIPFQFEDRRKLIYRFDLIANIPLPDWIPVLNALAAHAIRVPADLAHLSWAQASGLAADFPAEQPVLLLWQAACICSTGTTPGTGGNQALVSPGQLASSFQGKGIEETSVAHQRTASLKELAIPADFDKLGPAAKIRKLNELPWPSIAIATFINNGAQLHLLRKVQDSLLSVAPGIQ